MSNQSPEQIKADKSKRASETIKERRRLEEEEKRNDIKKQIKSGNITVSQASDAQMAKWKKERENSK